METSQTVEIKKIKNRDKTITIYMKFFMLWYEELIERELLGIQLSSPFNTCLRS